MVDQDDGTGECSKPPVGLEPTTCGLQNRDSDPVTVGIIAGCGESKTARSSSDSSGQSAPRCDDLQDNATPEAAAIADALVELPESERAAMVDHVCRLVRMSSGKRAAVFTLVNV